MARVTFIAHDGTSRTVEVKDGHAVMTGARDNGLPGIEAECGGVCACATCHVYVPPEWAAKLPPAADLETAMLEFAAHVQENSRLSCQIKAGPHLDGLVVHTPESQH